MIMLKIRSARQVTSHTKMLANNNKKYCQNERSLTDGQSEQRERADNQNNADRASTKKIRNIFFLMNETHRNSLEEPRWWLWPPPPPSALGLNRSEADQERERMRAGGAQACGVIERDTKGI